MHFPGKFFVFMLCSASICAAQSSQTTPEFHVQSNIVLVPTLVRDSAGKPVYTLQASDFQLTDDGVPQTLRLDEETTQQPLALVLVLENGGLGRRHLDDLDKIGALLDAVVGNVPHHVALLNFDSTPHLAQSFTTDLGTVRDSIETLPAGDDGAAMLDALQMAIQLLSRQPASYRRAILLVGETLDHGSHIRLEDAVRSVSETNTAIYSIAFSSSRAHASKELSETMRNDTPGPPNGCMGHEPGVEPAHGKKRVEQGWDCLNLLAPPLRIAQLLLLSGIDSMRQNAAESTARISGGEYFHFKNAATLEADLETLANHLPNRYLLSFHPQNPHPGLHRIEVKLPDYPQLTLSARGNYWADEK